MRIVFFGSDDFALTCLDHLIDSRHEVVACVTQPDRPKGRGMKVVISPIKECATQNNIPVLQPSHLKDAAVVKQLKEFDSDLFVVIAYGKFLPPEVLQIPKICAMNVHGSLLPKYRGAAPINWAVINGEEETGITIIKINDVMDSGDIFAQEKVRIDSQDTAVTIRARMLQIGPTILLETINSLEKGIYSLIPQNSQNVTFAPKLTKELGHIQWDKTAVEIHNLVRGLFPWPAAYTFYKEKLLKILKTKGVTEDISPYKPGEVTQISKEGFVVATGKSGLLIKHVQLQDAKQMDAHSFVIGHKLEVGFRFG